MRFLRNLVIAIVLSHSLAGCGAINGWLAQSMGDHWPTWAGGLPLNTPPRPGDPNYAEFEQKIGASSDPAASKRPDAKQPDSRGQ